MLESLPVGTVLPFLGIMHTQNVLKLFSQGWVFCDGASYATHGLPPAGLPSLFDVIGIAHGGSVVGSHPVHFRVPYLLDGELIRGVNGAAVSGGRSIDPQTTERPPPPTAENANSGNAVGSYQGYATGRPTTPFATDSQGDHSHVFYKIVDADHHAYEPSGGHEKGDICDYNEDYRPTNSAGAHTHVLSGGDEETYPKSVTVHWIIKYEDVDPSIADDVLEY